MIFVILGNSQLSFIRLIQLVELCKIFQGKTIIYQFGSTPFDPVKYPNSFDYVNRNKYETIFKQSELVISHAGVGTIIDAGEYQKPLVIVPRRKKENEHHNDHQTQICHELIQNARPGIFPILDESIFEQTVSNALNFNKNDNDSYNLHRRKLMDYLSTQIQLWF